MSRAVLMLHPSPCIANLRQIPWNVLLQMARIMDQYWHGDDYIDPSQVGRCFYFKQQLILPHLARIMDQYWHGAGLAEKAYNSVQCVPAALSALLSAKARQGAAPEVGQQAPGLKPWFGSYTVQPKNVHPACTCHVTKKSPPAPCSKKQHPGLCHAVRTLYALPAQVESGGVTHEHTRKWHILQQLQVGRVG